MNFNILKINSSFKSLETIKTKKMTDKANEEKNKVGEDQKIDDKYAKIFEVKPKPKHTL